MDLTSIRLRGKFFGSKICARVVVLEDLEFDIRLVEIEVWAKVVVLVDFVIDIMLAEIEIGSYLCQGGGAGRN
jgi:hypothetical protein